MIKNSIVIFSLIFLFFSCKKDTTVSPPATNFSNITSTSVQDTMLPLSVGNYWIYQKSQDDSMGGYVMLNEFDSVYVIKDSIIMGEKYFKLQHSNNQFMSYFNFEYGYDTMHVWIKDSLGSLINYPRKTYLDVFNLRDTISRNFNGSPTGCYGAIVPDTFLNRNFILGNYSGIWMKNYSITTYPYNIMGGMNMFDAFVKNIGLIKSRWAFAGCPRYCRYSQHLIRYHLN